MFLVVAIMFPDGLLEDGQGHGLVRRMVVANGDRLVDQVSLRENSSVLPCKKRKLPENCQGQVLVDLGFIEEQLLIQFLTEASGHEVFDPKSTIFDGENFGLGQ